MRVAVVSRRDLENVDRWRTEWFATQPTQSRSTWYSEATIAEIVVERKEFLSPAKYPDRMFNYIGLEHVESDTGELVDFHPRRGEAVKSRSKIFRHGDVLYCRLRPYLNKIFLADDRTPEGIASGEFFVLTPKPGSVDGRYLRAILASRFVLERVRELQTGSTLPRLPLDSLLSMTIPVPEWERQAEWVEFVTECETRRREAMRQLSVYSSQWLEVLADALEEDKVPTLKAVDSKIDTSSGEQINDNPLP